MKVTIDISDQDVAVLRKWASVSRSFDLFESVFDLSHEDAYYAVEELNTLRHPLDRVQASIRSALYALGIE